MFPLATLLETAPKTKLVDPLVRVAGTRPDVRREYLETMIGDWKLDHARRIYRRLGNREKYLELRQFVAKRAKSAGNRERYLVLQFDQAIDHLTCDKYKAFRLLHDRRMEILRSEDPCAAGEGLGHGATPHPPAPQGA